MTPSLEYKSKYNNVMNELLLQTTNEKIIIKNLINETIKFIATFPDNIHAKIYSEIIPRLISEL